MRGGTKRQRALFAAVALAVLLADQLAKLWVEQALAGGETISLLGGRLTLRYVTNTGAAFGVMRHRPDLLVFVAGAAIVFLLWIGLAMGTRARLAALGLGMILGGAAGNLVDRLLRGYVVDFIDVHFWPQFNVADIAVTVGAVLVGLYVALVLPAPERGEEPLPRVARGGRIRVRGGVGVLRRPASAANDGDAPRRAQRPFLALRRRR